MNIGNASERRNPMAAMQVASEAKRDGAARNKRKTVRSVHCKSTDGAINVGGIL